MSSVSPLRLALAGLAALALAMGIGRFAFTPVLPMMLAEGALSLGESGWLASANYAGYLAGALSAIGLRVRASTAIRAGLLLMALSTVAMGLAGHFTVWLVLRAVAGVASAWVLVFVSASILERLARAGRAELGGTVYAGVGLGIVAAGFACLALMAAGASSGAAWLVLGAASLALTFLFWKGLDAPSSTVPGETAQSPDLSRAELARLVLSYGAFGFGYIIPATFLPVMARQAIESPALFGWAWPVFGAAAAASTLAAARLARTLGYRGLWIASSLVMAFGVAAPLFIPGLAGILAAALCVGSTFVVITMAGLQEARRLAGDRARGLIAGMTSAFALGQIVGPLAASALVQWSGGFAPALVVAAALLAASAIALALRA
ncbi:MAG TPA: YbfB/YjiJ family MFS transporter [Burkholderiales bacterium]|nr:YbfB/YjiJ family MFS transporter [Burkholderiales bacterium]